jgi:hypothetical protein
MSHFAEIDENNIVLRVLVGDNDFPNEGYDWFVENLGGTWIQTSYNSNFRNRFAKIGDLYHSELDAFIDPKPYDSWVLDTHLLTWVAPIPEPKNNKNHIWDEPSLNWVEITEAQSNV